MSAPKLSIVVEPSEGNSLVYLPLAPPKEGGMKNAQLSLRLDITNQEDSDVHASEVQLAFANPAAPAATIPIDLEIGAGDTGAWYFSVADNVLLPEPTPQQITVGGVQLFAYDMEVVAKNSDGNWSYVEDGGDSSKNEDHLVWGKPVCAMADGTVVDFDDSQPTNPTPGSDLSPPGPVEGNHFYIQHGDELMLYAHLQPGSLPGSLMSKGASVEAGDLLGLAGNSGNSSRPHLHIHSIEGTQPWQGTCRPIPFREIQVLDRTETPLSGPDAEWVEVHGRGLPSVLSLILPHDDSEGGREWVAVDPLSLILSRAIYVRLTLPDPPPYEQLVERIGRMIAGMSPEERRQALAQVEKLKPYVAALEAALEESW